MSTASDDTKPMIDTLWNWSDPAESERRFRARADESKRAGDRADYLEALTQVARALALQRKFTEGHEVLDTVAPGNDTAALDALPGAVAVRTLLERGRLYNSAGSKTDARACFLDALARAEAAGFDFYAVDAAHMMGIIEPQQQALEWNGLAMNMAENSADDRTKGWLGPLRNNTGWTLYEMGEYERALELFEKDYEFRSSRNRPGEARIARYSMGKTMRALGRVDEALVLQLELQEQFKGDGKEDGYVCEEIGECLLALNRADESKSWFASAHRLLSTDAWLADREPERIARLLRLSA